MAQYANVAFLVLQDAFVLCRVTKRNDWALENDNEVGNGNEEVGSRNPHPQQPNGAATSVVIAVKPEDAAASVNCAEELNHVAAPVGSAQLSNDVSMDGITADTAPLNGSNELDALLESLLDNSPSFNPVPDTGSAAPPLTEQYAESLVSFLMLAVVLNEGILKELLPWEY